MRGDSIDKTHIDRMEPIETFTLVQHSGPYESWPARTELFNNNVSTGTELPGYIIEAQYHHDNLYLIVLSQDCPFDEMNEIVLLNAQFKLLSRKSIPRYLVNTHWPISETAICVHFIEQVFYIISIEPPPGWFRRNPYLLITQITAPEQDSRAKQSMIALATALEEIRTEHNRSPPNEIEENAKTLLRP